MLKWTDSSLKTIFRGFFPSVLAFFDLFLRNAHHGLWPGPVADCGCVEWKQNHRAAAWLPFLRSLLSLAACPLSVQPCTQSCLSPPSWNLVLLMAVSALSYPSPCPCSTHMKELEMDKNNLDSLFTEIAILFK